MANTDRTRFLRTVVRGVPVAVLAALVSLPAAALTTNAGSVAASSAGAAVQPLSSTSAELKVQKRAEKQARKACKKAMKRAKKRGQTYSCSAAGSGAETEAADGVESIAAEEPASDSANDASSNGKPANPGQGNESGSQGNPGNSGSPGNPGNPGNSGNPGQGSGNPNGAGAGDEGATDGIIRNALVGPDSIPSGLTPESILDEGGGDETPPSIAQPERVPEPGSLALLGLGLMGLAIGQRRRTAATRR